ncbi:MAG: glycosyltransferase [Ilyomonas sp.]
MKMIVIIPLGEEKTSYSYYLIQLLKEIYPDHGVEEQIDLAGAQKYPHNSIIIIKTTNRSNFSVRWWYRVVLPSFVSKVKPQFILHLNGCNNLSIQTPQLTVVTEIQYLQKPEKLLSPLKNYSKKNFSSFAQKANTVITYAKTAESFLKEELQVPITKMQVIFPTIATEVQPLEWGEKQLYKLQYTNAKEFFLISRDFRNIDELVFMLKAFSVFKKWQHSSMKLLIAGKLWVDEKDWQEKLSSYKFKDDVVMQEHLNDYYYEKIVASAYAFIHAPTNESDIIPALEAVSCRTPVISFANEVIKEMMGDSFLTAENYDFNLLGQKMIQLYKDETLRDKMISEAEQKLALYKREDAQMQLKKLLEQYTGK